MALVEANQVERVRLALLCYIRPAGEGCGSMEVARGVHHYVVRHADVLSALELQRIVTYVRVRVVCARVVVTGGGRGGG
eukprot:scaffold129662_cov72-Phaeocystis_antarctica.AAC.5